MTIILEVRGSVTVAACDCCDRFCSADGGVVSHASHCDGGKRSERYTPAQAPVAPAIAVRPPTAAEKHAIKNGAVSKVYSDDNAIVAAVRRGFVSDSDALNRDF